MSVNQSDEDCSLCKTKGKNWDEVEPATNERQREWSFKWLMKATLPARRRSPEHSYLDSFFIRKSKNNKRQILFFRLRVLQSPVVLCCASESSTLASITDALADDWHDEATSSLLDIKKSEACNFYCSLKCLLKLLFFFAIVDKAK